MGYQRKRNEKEKNQNYWKAVKVGHRAPRAAGVIVPACKHKTLAAQSAGPECTPTARPTDVTRRNKPGPSQSFPFPLFLSLSATLPVRSLSYPATPKAYVFGRARYGPWYGYSLTPLRSRGLLVALATRLVLEFESGWWSPLRERGFSTVPSARTVLHFSSFVSRVSRYLHGDQFGSDFGIRNSPRWINVARLIL